MCIHISAQKKKPLNKWNWWNFSLFIQLFFTSYDEIEGNNRTFSSSFHCVFITCVFTFFVVFESTQNIESLLVLCVFFLLLSNFCFFYVSQLSIVLLNTISNRQSVFANIVNCARNKQLSIQTWFTIKWFTSSSIGARTSDYVVTITIGDLSGKLLLSLFICDWLPQLLIVWYRLLFHLIFYLVNK